MRRNQNTSAGASQVVLHAVVMSANDMIERILLLRLVCCFLFHGDMWATSTDDLFQTDKTIRAYRY